MIPGVAILDGFLGRKTASALLDFAQSHEAGFHPSKVSFKGQENVASQTRHSLTFVGDWSVLERTFCNALLRQAPDILAETGVADWSPKHLQIDLAAYRDGGFYNTHIDTVVGAERGRITRKVSAVYYVHAEPKPFSGGELRIRDVLTDQDCVIAPKHDRLVAFASILPHEVQPVSIAGDAFAHARFSINCWLSHKAD